MAAGIAAASCGVGYRPGKEYQRPGEGGLANEFTFVALLSLGMAFIGPNLSALVSRHGGAKQAGASLGIQNAANSLGQSVGPALGGVLFIWQINAPYVFSGAVLLVLASVLGWNALHGQREVRVAS